MRVAEFLSDLTTLRPEVCDQKSALSLVSLRPDSATAKPNDDKPEEDKDLKRARDLLDLHSTVKLAHADGRDHELMQAREQVGRVLDGL